MKSLISLAYNVRAFQLSGGSQWVDTEPSDIEARAATSVVTTPTDPAKMSEEQHKANERLRSLLADRFQLTLHPVSAA